MTKITERLKIFTRFASLGWVSISHIHTFLKYIPGIFYSPLKMDKFKSLQTCQKLRISVFVSNSLLIDLHIKPQPPTQWRTESSEVVTPTKPYLELLLSFFNNLGLYIFVLIEIKFKNCKPTITIKKSTQSFYKKLKYKNCLKFFLIIA